MTALPSATIRSIFVDTSRARQVGSRAMRMHPISLAVVLLLSAARGFAAPCATLSDLGIDSASGAFCDPLVPEQCMLPFPNDYFTVSDPGTRTHRRINF